MHSTTVKIPVAGQQVEHHCIQERGSTYKVRQGSTLEVDATYLDGTPTEMVEFGERCIRAAIEHASPDTMTAAEVWLQYLEVQLDRAQAAVRAERERDAEIWGVPLEAVPG